MSCQRTHCLFMFPLLILSLGISISDIQAEKRIAGAFGFIFGEQLPDAMVKNATPDEHGLARNEVVARDPSPHFEMYSVSIIPDTRQIAMVTASKVIKNDRDKAQLFFRSRKEEMVKNLGNPSNSTESVTTWKSGGVEVVLILSEVKDDNNPMSVIVLLYSDNAIVELASKRKNK